MNKLNKILLSAVAGMMLVGCASTSSNSSSGGEYPVLKVLSDKPYVWDDSISEALNVARMAQPAGVGNGMMDYIDGSKATTGRLGAGIRAFDASIGLISNGIFGVIQHEALSQGVNRQLEWKPSIVQLIEMNELMSEDGSISFFKVSHLVSDGVKKSVEKSYPGISWGPVLIPKDQKLSNLSISINDLDKCKNAMDFISVSKSHIGYIDQPYSRFFINGDGIHEKHCLISLKISIAGKDNNGKAIVVSEIISGHYFNDAIVKNHEEYVIVPDIYFIRASDSAKDIAIATENAFVSKNGDTILFQKKM